jgi:hypothetical protein
MTASDWRRGRRRHLSAVSVERPLGGARSAVAVKSIRSSGHVPPPLQLLPARRRRGRPFVVGGVAGPAAASSRCVHRRAMIPVSRTVEGRGICWQSQAADADDQKK